MSLMGTFQVGPSGIVVGDKVYDGLEYTVHLAAAPGAWTARVDPESHEDPTPHRSLVALHDDEAAADELTWRVVEARLCTDSCVVVLADADFRAGADAVLRRMGPVDALVGDEPRGAQFVCCYDPWRCEVSAAEREGAIVGVRVCWYSNDCEPVSDTFTLDGVEHWLELKGGSISVINEQCWSLARSFDDFSWCGFDEGMDELRVPEALRPRLRAILERHGAFVG